MAGAGDFLKHVNKGESVEPTADTWNAFVDSAAAGRERRVPIRATGRDIRFAPQLVRVSNTASSAPSLDRFSVVGLGDPVITTERYEHLPTAIGHEPGTSGGNFGGSDNQDTLDSQVIAVLMEPIPAGKMGEAMVAGVAKVFLDGIPVEDSDPSAPSPGQRCNPKLGETDYMTVATLDDRYWGRFPIISVDAWDEDLELFPALILLHDTPLVYDPVIVRVSLSGGADPIPRGSVIAVSGPITGTSFDTISGPLITTVSATAPSGAATETIGVTISESITVDRPGLAVVSGFVRTRVLARFIGAPIDRCNPPSATMAYMDSSTDLANTYGRFKVVFIGVYDGLYYPAVVDLRSEQRVLPYVSGTPTDWSVSAPTTVLNALDRLAALVKTLNGGTGA